MKRLLPLILLSALLFSGNADAQILNLSAKKWDPTGWNVRIPSLALAGNAKHLTDGNAGSVLTVDIPEYSGGNSFNTLNYFTTLAIGSGAQTQISITMIMVTTGTPLFHWQTETGNNCVSNCSPAAFRPMIWTEFSGTCSNGQDYSWCDRWWPVGYSFVLGPGTITWTIPMDPAQWTGVHGQTGLEDPVAWQAMTQLYRVGVTCGGGYFYAHGCYVTGGTAQLQIQGYTIQ